MDDLRNPLDAIDDPYDLLTFAKAWANLGECIQQQVLEVCDLGKAADVNPEAIRHARQNLTPQSITGLLDEWLEAHEG